jgi:mono/diheme cytochrome c family protein
VSATTRILGHSLFALGLLGCVVAHAENAQELFELHCAECHGPDRLGRIGPALLPENLGRLKPEEAVATIVGGRPATQMPAFGEKLKPDEIQSLVELIFTPLPEVPA